MRRNGSPTPLAVPHLQSCHIHRGKQPPQPTAHAEARPFEIEVLPSRPGQTAVDEEGASQSEVGADAEESDLCRVLQRHAVLHRRQQLLLAEEIVTEIIDGVAAQRIGPPR